MASALLKDTFMQMTCLHSSAFLPISIVPHGQEHSQALLSNLCSDTAEHASSQSVNEALKSDNFQTENYSCG